MRAPIRPRPFLILLVISLPVAVFGARMRLFEVRTSTNFLFDIMVESNMAISNGLSDAYDGCYMLRVAGTEVRTQGVTILFAGRGVQSTRQDIDGLIVSRQVYVPNQGDWARYYDLIINRSKTARTVDVEIFGNLGSDSSTKIVATSDSDTTIETSDTWFVTDDFADGGGDPTLAHVFRRAKSKARPQSVTLSLDNISIRYQLKLAPRTRSAIVTYAVQTQNSANAIQIARELVKFDSTARAHLSSEDIRYIRN